MKRKLIVLAALFIIFVVFVLVRFFLFDNPGKMGRMKVLSSPTAQIFVDNVASGKTPIELRLKPGTYTVKLIPEGENTQKVTWTGKATIRANSLTYITRDLGTTENTSAGQILTVEKMSKSPRGDTGQVSLETDPTGAIVFLDNDEKGVTPLILDEVSVGNHELAVFLPGFFRLSQKINVQKGEVVKAVIKLGLDKTRKTLAAELEEKRKEASTSATTTDEKKSEEEAPSNEKKVKIKDTPTGFLNVREDATATSAKVTEVNPGDTFAYSKESNGWYFITLPDGDEGWVIGDFVEVLD